MAMFFGWLITLKPFLIGGNSKEVDKKIFTLELEIKQENMGFSDGFIMDLGIKSNIKNFISSLR